tara:strand:+ start:3683 stop:4390 length:708 start_codon:yes stop_codon:yes gene_type:complete
MVELKHRNILLDVGDTLVRINQPFEVYTLKAIKFLAQDLVNQRNEDIESLVNQLFIIRNEIRAKAHESLREYHFNEYLEEIESQLNVQFTKPYLELETQYVQAELAITKRIEGVLEMLKAAKNEGKRLIISTNNFSPQHVKLLLQKFEIEAFIDEVYISAEMKIRKPSIKFIDSICNELDLNKKETIILGDKPHMDILAAINAGIDSCWYNPKGAVQTDYPATFEVKNLSQLKFI